MKEKYEFKDAVKSLYKGIDAQRVGEEIKNLGGTEENPVKPEMILEYAKNNTESELHKCIDWNDSVAAEKWRLAQARHVTRSIVIVRNDEKLENQPKFEVRAFLEETRGSGYRPITFILEHEDSYEKMLKTAWMELRAFKKKYHMLKELNEIFALID